MQRYGVISILSGINYPSRISEDKLENREKEGFCLLSLILINSCNENGTNSTINSFQKVKITIYYSYSGDTNDYVKNSEYFFDGDIDGYPRRMLMNNMGVSNYKSILSQERSNVPLPLYKYGCLTKNIEYSNDSSFFALRNNEFDNDGYITKFSFDFYSSNKSTSAVFTREGDKLLKISLYKENILEEIINYINDANGLCILEVDSVIQSKNVRKTFRRYNKKKELIYSLMGKDTTSGSVTEYFYDNNGNNIKQLSYTKINNDTSNSKVYNYVIYNVYRIEQNKLERFEFDSKGNIIGYINPDFGKSRYKIEYTYY